MLNTIDEDRQILLEHARHPKRVGVLNDAHGRGHCHNPLCGDKVSVTLVTENNLIKSIMIEPSGCSISLASASLMTELVEGKSIEAVTSLIERVNYNFTPKIERNDWPSELNILSPLMRIRENAMKIPCVLISWIAVKDAIKDAQGSTK